MARNSRFDRGIARPVLWLVAAGGLALVAAGAASSWLSPEAPTEPEWSRERFEQETGLRLVRVALTGGGGLIDIRWQVLDPDKALVVHDPRSPPAIVDQASCVTVDRTWMQHAHKRKELRMASTYYTLLVNAGGVVRRGSTVTFQVGEARLPGVTVQ